MKISQFTVHANLEQLVEFLNSNFKLTHFYIDDYPIDILEEEALSIEKFDYLMANLPVKLLNTCCFARQKSCSEFLSHLVGSDNCPGLVLDLYSAHILFSEKDVHKLIIFAREKFPDSTEKQIYEDKKELSSILMRGASKPIRSGPSYFDLMRKDTT